MRVTLIVPHTEKVAQSQFHMIPQLGVGYLAACLQARGHHCVVVDAKMANLRFDEALDRIVASEPQILGITTMTHEIVRSHGIAKAIKSKDPAVTVFVGGCHASALPVETLKDFPHFDALVEGEGELAFPLAVEAVADGGRTALADVMGVTSRQNGGIRRNGSAPPIGEIDALSFPAWELFPHSDVYPLSTSRGCPFNCNFCQHVHSRKVRFRSPENVLLELKRLVRDFGAKDVRVRDESFTVKKDRAIEICELIQREGLHKKVKWSCTTHCNTVNREVLTVMKRAGCRFVGFGVESGNADILARMGKQLTKDRVRKAVSDAKAAGLRTGGYFIIGHPYETKETIKDTIKFAAELNTSQVVFGSMVPYPGSEVYDMARRGEGGYRHLSRDWTDYDKHLGNSVEMEGLSRRDLDRAQIKAYLHFYGRNFRVPSALRFFFRHRKPIVAAGLRLLRRSLPGGTRWAAFRRTSGCQP